MGSVAADPGRVRLHITPFNPTLLDRFIPSSLRPLATDISFHTLQTFPETGFGYVELPKIEAENLKKKLNGMTLKGSKVRIEEAKPSKKRKPDGAIGDENEERERKERKKAKKEKRKKEQGVLEGHELDSERFVKRGWEDKGADKKAKRKDKKEKIVSKEPKVENREMRFKTEIPPNALPVEKSSKDGKEKKEKKEKKKGDKKQTVVKEFEKSLKLRHIKTKPGKPTKFQEGQGWMDEHGELVEPEAPSAIRERKSKEKAEQRSKTKSSKSRRKSARRDSDSESEFSSEDPSSSEDESESEATSDDDGDEADDSKSESGKPEEQAVEPKEVHPLEALFKRPAPSADSDSANKPVPAPIDTSFNFFLSGEVDSDQDEPMNDAPMRPPHTPHTQRDMEWRGLRSGAPTPDTAAIGRKFTFPFGGDEDDDDAEMGDDVVEPETPITKAGPSNGEFLKKATGKDGEREESEFRKWFYENRGDLNRGWKKRRREERKSKRQLDNRVLSRKVV